MTGIVRQTLQEDNDYIICYQQIEGKTVQKVLSIQQYKQMIINNLNEGKFNMIKNQYKNLKGKIPDEEYEEIAKDYNEKHLEKKKQLQKEADKKRYQKEKAKKLELQKVQIESTK